MFLLEAPEIRRCEARDAKHARVNFADRNKTERNTGRKGGGAGGAGGTIRSGRPLMLSICPHLGDHRGYHAPWHTPCTQPHGTFRIVLTRSRVHERAFAFAGLSVLLRCTIFFPSLFNRLLKLANESSELAENFVPESGELLSSEFSFLIYSKLAMSFRRTLFRKFVN